MENWALIYNPTAGKFRPGRLEAIERALREGGVRSRLMPTERPGHGLELGRAVHGVERVAVFGGDGTLNEVADGLVGRELPLVFLPGGTANVMAHELGLPQDPAAAVRRLLAGRVIAVRPGVLEGRHFLLMAGFGFDGAAVHGVSPRLKARLGKAAYVWAGLGALTAGTPELRFSPAGDGGAVCWVVAARAGYYGGAFRLHPRAGLIRSRLGLVTVRRGWVLPFLLCNLGLGLPLSAGGIALGETETFRLEAEAPVHAQVDGEYWGAAERFQVGLSERTLLLCVPAAWPSAPSAPEA